MNGFIWVFAVVLALVFLAAGINRAFRYQKSRDLFPWVKDVPRPLAQLIGVLEILGALGLVLPAATGIYPILSVVAAAGLAVLMLAAGAFHLLRREGDSAALNLLLLLFTAFLAYGHWTLLP